MILDANLPPILETAPWMPPPGLSQQRLQMRARSRYRLLTWRTF